MLTLAQQGKRMDNKFFICENINIFGYLRLRVTEQSSLVNIICTYKEFHIHMLNVT